jgi:GTPase SAR1 family protein
MRAKLVYGDSGMGKSMLVEKFKDDYGPGNAAWTESRIVGGRTGGTAE